MKKLLPVFIMFAFLTQISFARVGNPAFVFDISQNSSSDDNKKDDDSLSSGAITAITLGSIGAASLFGIFGWLYKRKASQCLTLGSAKGSSNLLSPFCMDENLNSEFYKRIDNNYPYLKKALSLNEIHYCPNSKYLLIYDTVIDKRKYDVIKFSIPNNTRTIKFTFVSDAFENNDITHELFLYKDIKQTQSPAEAKLKNILKEQKQGIVIEKFDFKDVNYSNADFVISNYSYRKKYALVIEFIF